MTRWWRTTVRYWCRTRDGEAYVRQQRHRLMPWRGRRVTVEFDGVEVTAE